MESDSAPESPLTGRPQVIGRAEHPISRKNISPNALRVLYRLRDGGFQAFLVGGCLRDLLLGLEPKDFDVATSAHPEQVKRLFRNCRLIGRRFRLAHVFFGQEIIEVATFRAASSPSPGEETEEDPDILPEIGASDDDATLELPVADLDEGLDLTMELAVTAEGRILRDNTYGTVEEDVWRRDFTCNALYYNIEDFSLWDYAGGLEDIRARRLRLIGDPEQRYREDPVRMLRAARFEAKLGFTLARETEAPIAELRTLLSAVPAARLFDETLKLFLTGHGERSLEVLQRRALLEVLYPTVHDYLQRHPGSLVEQLLRAGLRNTDERVQADKPVSPTFLFSLLLYGPIAANIERAPSHLWHDTGTILDACDWALRDAQQRVTIPRRFALGVREMFALQPRLERPHPRRVLRMLEQPRFRAGFDLLVLRGQVGMASAEAVDWWTRIQTADLETRQTMLQQLERSGSGGGSDGAGAAPRKRHRRRRRPESPA